MKKLLKIVCYILISILAICILWDQTRTYYCFSNGKCFTLWKRIGGKCYIVFDKYYGVTVPRSGYIQTFNWSTIDIINDNHFVVVGDSTCKVVNDVKGQVVFYAATDARVDSMYTHKEGNYFVYNKDIEYYSIDILEQYARTNVKK